jgi:hypothetical protein
MDGIKTQTSQTPTADFNIPPTPKNSKFKIIIFLTFAGITVIFLSIVILYSLMNYNNSGLTKMESRQQSAITLPEYIEILNSINNEKKSENFQCFDCGKGKICQAVNLTFLTNESLDQILANLNSAKGWTFTQETISNSLNHNIGEPKARGTISDGEYTYNIKIYVGSANSNGPTSFRISYVRPLLDKKYSWPQVTESERANWNEYKDPEGLFTLKTPSDWNRILNPDEPCETCGGVDRGIYITISNPSRSFNEDLEETSKYLYTNHDGSGVLEDTPEFISKYNGKVVCGIPGAGFPGFIAYIPIDGKVLEIYSESIDNDTASKILSTLEINR